MNDADVGPDAVARVLGVEMHVRAHFETALTHSSFVNEQSEPTADNERLEFLGDAVIGFVVGERVFRALPDADEGELTRIRAALVCQPSLAGFARQMGLGSHIRLGRGEEVGGGRVRPVLLCAAFEAIIGAVYLDDGIEACGRVLDRFIGPELERLVVAKRGKDARSQFQEAVQARWRVTPHYAVSSQLGPAHARHFIVEVRVGEHVWASGEGRSKSEASQAAALAAMAVFEASGVDGAAAGGASQGVDLDA